MLVSMIWRLDDPFLLFCLEWSIELVSFWLGSCDYDANNSLENAVIHPEREYHVHVQVVPQPEE